MSARKIYPCQCEICKLPEAHALKKDHHRMNVLLSRLDEQQRRWYVALEAERVGHGGTEALSQITGMNIDTIRKGRQELSENLEGRPTDRVRLPGGGRKAVEKRSHGRRSHAKGGSARHSGTPDRQAEMMGKAQSAHHCLSVAGRGASNRAYHGGATSAQTGLWSGSESQELKWISPS